MNATNRKSDLSPKQFIQTKRFYAEDGLWYFKTREGSSVGPFRYLSEAEKMLERFLADIEAARIRQQITTSVKPHFRTPAIASESRTGSSGRIS